MWNQVERRGLNDLRNGIWACHQHRGKREQGFTRHPRALHSKILNNLQNINQNKLIKGFITWNRILDKT